MNPSLAIYCDGAARLNNIKNVPTKCSIGVVVYLIDSRGNRTRVAQVSRKEPTAKTNNESEYLAMIKSMKVFREINKETHLPGTIYADSLLVVSQVTGKWQCKSETLRPFYVKAVNLYRTLMNKGLSIKHIRREFNQEADALANQALDQA